MKTASEMRADQKLFQSYKQEISRHAVVEMRPIREWFGRTYILLGTIDLKPQAQAVDVIDITDNPEVARFAKAWPQEAYQHDHAVVIFPDEGHTSMLCEDGTDTWVLIAALPVQVQPPGFEDAKRALDEIDEYDIAQIDAGGTIQFNR